MMSTLTPRLLSLALASLAVAGCDSDHRTLVDLTVEHSATVEFTSLPVDSPEEAVIPFGDLRQESRYVDLKPQIRCVGLDLAGSFIDIVDLDSDVTPLPFLLLLEVAPAGTSDFQPLADFDGTIANRDFFQLSDPFFTIHPAGRALLEDIALSDRPAYDVRVTGELISYPADRLLVDVFLTLDFSNDTRLCP